MAHLLFYLMKSYFLFIAKSLKKKSIIKYKNPKIFDILRTLVYVIWPQSMLIPVSDSTIANVFLIKLKEK